MSIRLVKAADVRSVANSQNQFSVPPRLRFTNWAQVFRAEQASKPTPQVQFRNLFKKEAVQ